MFAGERSRGYTWGYPSYPWSPLSPRKARPGPGPHRRAPRGGEHPRSHPPAQPRKPQTPNPKPQTPNPKPHTPNPKKTKPQTSNFKSQIFKTNPQPTTRNPNPKPENQNPDPESRNSKAGGVSTVSTILAERSRINPEPQTLNHSP